MTLEVDLNADVASYLSHGNLPSGIPENFPVLTEAISYAEFFERFILSNIPCLIRVPGFIEKWNSWTQWRGKLSDRNEETIDLDAISSIVPDDHSVPISQCGVRHFNAHECRDSTFKEFKEYWKNRKDEVLYLKDWHFHREFPKYEAYQTPIYFRSDWLNEFCDHTQQNDYKFVYIGPKDSWTPFHYDVFGSFSWSANVVGRKHWVFVPPGQEKVLLDQRGNLPFDLFDANVKDKLKDIKYYEVIQESGDVMFVPSLWHHQVKNLVDTLSINHNWFNGANIEVILTMLNKALQDVEKELSDCRPTSTDEEWIEMCQKVLKANHGMNHEDLAVLMLTILNRRKESKSTAIGEHHILFDIEKITSTLDKIPQKFLTENTVSQLMKK